MPILALLFFLLLTPLVALYAALGLARSPSRWRKYLPFFVLAFFMVAYTYHPQYEMDLTRYYDVVREISNYKRFDRVLNYGNDGLFVRNLFFWLIGKTGDVQLLPAITVSTVYGVAAYITCDAASECNKTKYIPLMLLMQILMLPYFSVISNIRNVFTFSLILLAAYLDIVKSRRSIGVLLLYTLPCFIHSSGIILLVFRLVLRLLERRQILVIAATLLFPTIIQFLYRNLYLFDFGGILGDILQVGISKVYYYWNPNDSYTAYELQILASRFDAVSRLFMTSFAVGVIVLAFFVQRRNLVDKKWNKFNSYVFLICIMVAACNVFVAPHYWRFYSAVVVACVPVLLPFLPFKEVKSPLLIEVLKYSLIVFGIGGLTMNARTLIGGADYLDWFKSIMLSSPYTILFGFIRNLI